jgi:hypothetical protein
MTLTGADIVGAFFAALLGAGCGLVLVILFVIAWNDSQGRRAKQREPRPRQDQPRILIIERQVRPLELPEPADQLVTGDTAREWRS